MSAPGNGGPSPAVINPRLLKTLSQDLGSASDCQLQQVVAMVDGLAERGDVDALLAPLRPRLAQLRPARPLRFSRLLFLPLDPLIVAPQAWIPGTTALPRSAIPPLADVVNASLGEAAATIETIIAGRSMADQDAIDAAAALLWPRAGEVLAAAPCPAGWTQAGLPETAYASIAEIAATVLRQATRIDALAHGIFPEGESAADALNVVLDHAQADGPVAWRMICLLLLLRLRQKQDVLRAMTTSFRQRDPAIRIAGDQAIEAALDHLERQGHLERRGPSSGQDIADAAMRLRHTVALLNGIVADGVGPARARRVTVIRAKVDAACQSQMKSGLAAQVLTPLALITAAPMDEAAAILCLDGMEQAARSLRALEIAGQMLGNAAPYATLLRNAADQIHATAAGGALEPADQARLVELLVGPEAGLAMLAEARGQQAA